MSRNSSAKKSKSKQPTFEELLPAVQEPQIITQEPEEEEPEEEPEDQNLENSEENAENDEEDEEEKEEDYLLEGEDEEEGLGALDKLVNQTKEEKLKKIQEYNERMAKRGNPSDPNGIMFRSGISIKSATLHESSPSKEIFQPIRCSENIPSSRRQDRSLYVTC